MPVLHQNVQVFATLDVISDQNPISYENTNASSSKQQVAHHGASSAHLSYRLLYPNFL